MCLTVKRTFSSYAQAAAYKPLIAKKDIKVYKVLNNFNKSIYQYFLFKKGTHYFQTGETPFGIKIWNCGYFYIDINDGLHSFISKKRAMMSTSYSDKIVEMIIPKGSKYYKGNDGDIVSDNLIWPND